MSGVSCTRLVNLGEGRGLLNDVHIGKLKTGASDLTTIVIWNSAINTHGAKCMVADKSNFYLATPFEHYHCTKTSVDLVTQKFINL